MSAAPAVRILVVDDSAFARKVVREVLERDARYEVVGIARDGIDALEKIAALAPDVVTLDLVMPNLDGIGVLRALGTLGLARPPRVVVVSMAEEDSDLAVNALQLGAVDLVRKPTALATDRLFEMADELLAKVGLAAAATPRGSVIAASMQAATPAVARARLPAGRRILCVGASTGGPQALTSLLAAFPAEMPIPIAIALHMPAGYTDALARRLDQVCAIEVLEAHHGIELIPGRAVIARAGMHLKIGAGTPPTGRLDLVPLDKPHHPSVDVLFESAAQALGGACMAVVLTGMGEDGVIGASAVRAARGTVLTETESSCVVYGMPRAVYEAGLSDAQASLDRMAEAILERL